MRAWTKPDSYYWPGWFPKLPWADPHGKAGKPKRASLPTWRKWPAPRGSWPGWFRKLPGDVESW